MNVQEVLLDCFMGHTKSALEVPSVGLVLVTGRNGAGKSSFLEAVSMCLWGKSIRGTSPWRLNESGFAHVRSSNLEVARSCSSKGRTHLNFLVGGVEQGPFPTTTKAQEALNSRIGSWEVWRRTNVFSSADVSHFTLSTDAERKSLLESILGLSQFDVALARCREDLKVVQTAYLEVDQSRSKAAQERHLREQWAEGCQKELEAIYNMAVSDTVMAQTLEETFALRAAREQIESKIRDEKVEHDALEQDLLHQAELGHKTKLQRRCVTCGQPLGLEEAEAAIAEELGRIRAESRRGWVERYAHLSKDLRQIQSELTQASESYAALSSRRTEQQRAMDAWNKRNDENQAALDTARAQEEQHRQALAELKAKRGLLEDAEQVLGLRGVRSLLLSKALGGIEDTANHWLSRMTGRDLKLELKPYTEKADGNTVDSISLDILGAGGGYGYKAASQGERRRIDVALLLALSEVAAAASGRPPGTLWVDEAFDALDEEGTDAIVEILGTLSQTRAVVVISHSEALVSKLPKAKHVHLS